MPTFPANQIRKQLEIDNQQILAQLKSEFLPLSIEKLNQKADPKVWSILECIEHLNLANEPYIVQMEQLLQKEGQNGENSLHSGWFKNYLINMVSAKEDGSIPNKMPTTAVFTPSSNLDTSVLERFQEKQERLLHVIRNSQKLDLNKNIIVSPVSSLIRFKFGDAMRFITAHSKRHMIQASNYIA